MLKIKNFLTLSFIALFMIVVITSCQQESIDSQRDIPAELLELVEISSYEDFKNETPSSLPRKAIDTGTSSSNSHYIIQVLVNDDCDDDNDFIITSCNNSFEDCWYVYTYISNYYECLEFISDCSDSFKGNCDF